MCRSSGQAETLPKAVMGYGGVTGQTPQGLGSSHNITSSFAVVSGLFAALLSISSLNQQQIISASLPLHLGPQKNFYQT